MSTVLLIALLLGAAAGMVLGLVIAGGGVWFVSARRLASGFEDLGTITKLMIYIALAGGGATAGVLLVVLLLRFLMRIG